MCLLPADISLLPVKKPADCLLQALKSSKVCLMVVQALLHPDQTSARFIGFPESPQKQLPDLSSLSLPTGAGVLRQGLVVSLQAPRASEDCSCRHPALLLHDGCQRLRGGPVVRCSCPVPRRILCSLHTKSNVHIQAACPCLEECTGRRACNSSMQMQASVTPSIAWSVCDMEHHAAP